jgi:uncharacterized phage protein (TIGR02220 family)
LARIRTLKPEFNKSKKVSELSESAQLFMVKLIVEVDDQGRLEWLPRTILGALYPHNEDIGPKELESRVKELEEAGIFMRWECSGKKYGCFVNWSEHQKIDRPSKARIPAPPMQVSTQKHDVTDADKKTLDENARVLREGVADNARVEEGNGKWEEGSYYSRAKPDDRPVSECEDQSPNTSTRSKSEKPGLVEIPGFVEVAEFFNRVCGRKFQPDSREFEGLRARMREGASAEVCKAVINHKQAEWGNDPKMVKNLVPSTLFRPGHWDRYVSDSEAGVPLKVEQGGKSDGGMEYLESLGL